MTDLNSDFEVKELVVAPKGDYSVKAKNRLIICDNLAVEVTLTFEPESAEPRGAYDEVEIKRNSDSTADVTITAGRGVTFKGYSGDVDIKIDGTSGSSIRFIRIAENVLEYSGNYKL